MPQQIMDHRCYVSGILVFVVKGLERVTVSRGKIGEYNSVCLLLALLTQDYGK